jgi:hypothetical protein
MLPLLLLLGMGIALLSPFNPPTCGVVISPIPLSLLLPNFARLEDDFLRSHPPLDSIATGSLLTPSPPVIFLPADLASDDPAIVVFG